MAGKMLQSKPLEKRNGLIICPLCGEISWMKRERIDDIGIHRYIRMCSNGHLFGSYKIMYLERMQGDIVPLKDIIKYHKERINGST